MVKRLFKNDVWVPEKIETVFQFFSSAKNLDRITPPWLRFHTLSPDVKLEKGAHIEYKLKIRGIPIRWLSQITEWNPPNDFTDTQIKGPYKSWVHRHRFYPEENGTRIADEVEYSVPGFIFEPFIDKFLVGPDIRRIFDYRTKTILKLFEAGSAATSPAQNQIP